MTFIVNKESFYLTYYSYEQLYITYKQNACFIDNVKVYV